MKTIKETCKECKNKKVCKVLKTLKETPLIDVSNDFSCPNFEPIEMSIIKKHIMEACEHPETNYCYAFKMEKIFQYCQICTHNKNRPKVESSFSDTRS